MDQKNQTILIVDDEVILSLSTSRVLQRHGYSVLTASSGEKAVKLCDDQRDIGLVLMDLDLGNGMNGAQVAKLILSTLDIPVLFLSSYTEPEVLAYTESVTSYGYVAKSSGEAVLLACIHMAFRLHETTLALKAREAALAESEERFRLAFYTSPDSINLNRLSDGVYIDCNEGFTSLTGYAKTDVLGKSSLELNIWNDPDDRGRLVESLKNSGSYDNLLAGFRRKDGTVVEALMSARIITLGGVPHILSVTRLIPGHANPPFKS